MSEIVNLNTTSVSCELTQLGLISHYYCYDYATLTPKKDIKKILKRNSQKNPKKTLKKQKKKDLKKAQKNP